MQRQRQRDCKIDGEREINKMYSDTQRDECERWRERERIGKRKNESSREREMRRERERDFDSYGQRGIKKTRKGRMRGVREQKKQETESM